MTQDAFVEPPKDVDSGNKILLMSKMLQIGGTRESDNDYRVRLASSLLEAPEARLYTYQCGHND